MLTAADKAGLPHPVLQYEEDACLKHPACCISVCDRWRVCDFKAVVRCDKCNTKCCTQQPSGSHEGPSGQHYRPVVPAKVIRTKMIEYRGATVYAKQIKDSPRLKAVKVT